MKESKLVMAKWLITRFQTLWPRRVTMLWHLCQSTLSRPHQIQWVRVNFCCSSNSLLLGADVLKYELCVYSPELFEAPCCNPSSKCHTRMSTTFKYSNPAGCQLHLWLNDWSGLIHKIPWKTGLTYESLCGKYILSMLKTKYGQPMFCLMATQVVLLQKKNSHLRSKKSSGSNSSYLKEAT